MPTELKGSKAAAAIAVLLIAGILACLAGGCSGTPLQSSGQDASSTFVPSFNDAVFDRDAAVGDADDDIDVSHAQDGYIGASAVNAAKLKLQIACGDQSYNYDLPGNGTPIICPLNMGDGTYSIRIMQNTSGNRYVEVFSTVKSVKLADETAPYIRPNFYCDYSKDSVCVEKAAALCQGAASKSEAFERIYDYICENVKYDYAEATSVPSGYVPNPDETLATGKGICFDYASLAAAMLRSQGIPCKIVTGYVSPDNVYHAWNMVYIDGTWTSVHISAPAGGAGWARVDLTFAANGAGGTIGDGTTYADRYTY